MDNYSRPVAIGAAIGGIATALIFAASLLPPAWASEEPLRTLNSSMNELLPHSIDPAKLVRRGDDWYEISADASVSLDPISTVVVSKIGYGQHTNVVIANTATGTYSSDAMVSPYVRYPGIEVEQVYPRHRSSFYAYSYRSSSHGRHGSRSWNAHSFSSVITSNGRTVIINSY